jgi:hypothetical protein
LIVQAVPIITIVWPTWPTVSLRNPFEVRLGVEQEYPVDGRQTFWVVAMLPKTPSLNRETMTTDIISMDHP